MARDDAAGGRHLLDHARAEREAEAGPDGVADDLGREAVAGVSLIGFLGVTLAALAVEQGLDPDRDGVVRWRRVDLQALIEARFAVRLHERPVGKVPCAGSASPACRAPETPEGRRGGAGSVQSSCRVLGW